MNPDLEFLLSRLYDDSIAPEHREDLRKSGLTDETIKANYIRSIPPGMITPLLKFDVPAVRSALLFPFRSPGGGFMDHIRMKVFPPLADNNGHTIKYLQPRHTAARIYFVGACLARVLEGVEDLYVVEGEKKALAVAQDGLPAVGICGIEGWHAKGSREIHPDFAPIPLRGRTVKVIPDADYRTNPDVDRAVRRLGTALEQAGARPLLVRVPAGFKGIDDWLASEGAG
jgi:hypothetical protein